MNVAIKNITVLKDKKEMYVCCVKIKKNITSPFNLTGEPLVTEISEKLY